MKKDDVRRVFDGSIFYQKAQEHAAARDKGAEANGAIKHH